MSDACPVCRTCHNRIVAEIELTLTEHGRYPVSGGQLVPHLHIHLIPRYQGDTENPSGGAGSSPSWRTTGRHETPTRRHGDKHHNRQPVTEQAHYAAAAGHLT